MTLAIRFESDDLALALALRLPPLRFDTILWSLIAALLLAIGGLAATVVLSPLVAGPVVWLPALVGAFGSLCWAVELLFAEVRRE